MLAVINLKGALWVYEQHAAQRKKPEKLTLDENEIFLSLFYTLDRLNDQKNHLTLLSL
jgi:hypothetical protein